jgi:type IV secretion system protein VirB3
MQAEAIYKGATRPAMKMGIPLVPLVVLFGTGMLLILWVGTLLTWWIVPVVLAAFVPALAWMRFVTRKDDQRFRQMFVALKLRIHDRNRRFWRSRSYSPVSLPEHERCLAPLSPRSSAAGSERAQRGRRTGLKPAQRTRSPASSRSRRSSRRTT